MNKFMQVLYVLMAIAATWTGFEIHSADMQGIHFAVGALCLTASRYWGQQK